MTIRLACESDLPTVRELFLEYEAELGIDLCFQQFHQEVAGLPGAYAEPCGALLLACDAEGNTVGCVALRRHASTGDCEMKRLYLRKAVRGKGIGRMLVAHLIKVADGLHYAGIRLDTLPTMTAAQSLYRSLGFQEMGAYAFNPIGGTVFMRKSLKDTGELT